MACSVYSFAQDNSCFLKARFRRVVRKVAVDIIHSYAEIHNLHKNATVKPCYRSELGDIITISML